MFCQYLVARIECDSHLEYHLFFMIVYFLSISRGNIVVSLKKRFLSLPPGIY